ncbi:DUF421 domain-containing protein [Hymenobacter sp. HMF4947]|uniref:DUF421 domain-containing protein n=1 Tax=Hymenobacter ginkgonis TaxID=2682976 RepID=A0A7K1TD77_9BACT|nr:YetF domain-containing protein [Hymenobacter ginkgonis]MVN76354.1 DUF421 domain-containing protein [Hymenobacter ginkgonis]
MTLAYLALLAADIMPFDWQRLWLSTEMPASFMFEIAFRCIVMFLLTIAALRISGKRGVRQLSLFEFALILVLGSAAGDATIYHDTPLLHAVVVFVVIIALYVLFNYLTDKYPRIERMLEGESELIIIEGEIDLPAFTKSSLTGQELCGQLRQLQVEHLGQVRRLYIEATGEISVFFFEPKHERPGLPIWPELYLAPLYQLPAAGAYACHACATVRELPAGPTPAHCPRCHQANGWLPVCATPRVA